MKPGRADGTLRAVVLRRRRTTFLVAAALALFAVSALALAAPAAGGNAGARAEGGAALRVVQCRGGGNACRARVSLAGGASNERVVIRLTDTDLRRVSIRPNRSYLRGAYLVSNAHYRLGGSQYVFTLNAVRAIPRGSYLFLTFRAPRR
jgi:hypothetical protein